MSICPMSVFTGWLNAFWTSVNGSYPQIVEQKATENLNQSSN